MTRLSTEGERTLSFAFIAPELPDIRGYKTLWELWTVPHQDFYDASRQC